LQQFGRFLQQSAPPLPATQAAFCSVEQHSLLLAAANPTSAVPMVNKPMKSHFFEYMMYEFLEN
jgi:hypothetical protein